MEWLFGKIIEWWAHPSIAAKVAVIVGVATLASMVFGALVKSYKAIRWCLRWCRDWHARQRLEGLTAGEPLPTPHFTGREEEKKLLAILLENHHVCAVEGPPLIGKSWLISEVIKSSGMAERCIFIELKPKSGLSALLFAINAGLVRLGCDDFDGICRSDDQTPTEKAQGLRPLLVAGNWVIVLDAYERARDGTEIDLTVQSWQGAIGSSRVMLGTRRKPNWVDDEAVVNVRPMQADEMAAPCETLGLQPGEAEEVCGKLAGLPGAVGVFRGLLERKKERAAMRLVGSKPEKLGRSLFDAAFKAAPQSAREVWMVASWFPQPLTREAAFAICGEQVFSDGVSLLKRWTVLTEGSERLDLHAWATRTGKRAMRWMALPWRGSKRWAWGQQAARFYAAFAEEKADDRDAIEAELENILAAARLAFEYGEWNSLWAMGDALDDPLDYAGRWTAREELLRLGYEGAGRAGDRQKRGDFAHNLAMGVQKRGQLERAEPLYRESLAVQQEAGEKRKEAITFHQLGMVAQDRGKLEEAEDLYRQSLEIAREVGDRSGEAYSLGQLGTLALSRGDLDVAEERYKEVQRVAGEMGDQPSEAISLHQLGTVAQDRGELEEAEGLYTQARDAFVEIGERRSEAAVLHQLGMVAQDRGKLEEAENLYRQSLEIKREVGHRPGEAKTLHNLGGIAQARRKLEEAEDWYKQSLEMKREVGDRPGEALTLWAMALLAEAQGDLGLAVERMEKAAGMMEEMGLGEAGQARGDLERLRRRLEEG